MKKTLLVTLILTVLQLTLPAQQVFTLEDCRTMAKAADKELEQARQKTVLAGYDRKIALANYFPNISATGTYMYNSRKLALVNDEQSAALTGLGTNSTNFLTGRAQSLIQQIYDPETAQSIINSPIWQAIVGGMSKSETVKALNSIGSEVNDLLHPDITNVYAGVVSLQQPVFVGGKIIASNQIAKMAEELSQVQYEEKCEETELQVEKSYWQIVSVAAKNRLAESYLDLLKQLEKDAEIAIAEGVAVQSDLLAVRVKKNEAQMLHTKTTNGLALSRMLMCKQLGLPLDTQFKLSDEDDQDIPAVEFHYKRDMDEILAERHETRMLDLAHKIYDKKVVVTRADMMPKIALTGNYLITNPNLFNGFNKKFGGMFNVGVLVSIPIFHGTEALQKTRKAKVEANIYKLKYEDACNMINLQVEQLYRQQNEAIDKLNMSKSNLDCAEENLRSAMLGFSEGVINSDVAMAAQTAWVKAQTEYIDAGIALQLTHSELLKAQAEYNK